jgi:hypothetical protein
MLRQARIASMRLRFRVGSTVVLGVPVLLRMPTLAQQGSGAREQAEDVLTTSVSRSDFDVKLDGGDFFVRRKGTAKWARTSDVSEPIAVGELVGNRSIYLLTRALTRPKEKHSSMPGYPDEKRNSGERGLFFAHRGRRARVSGKA